MTGSRGVPLGTALAIAVATLSAGAPRTGDAQATDLGWHVLGGGGGSSQAGSVFLDGTAGQALAGTSGGGDFVFHAGFWPGLTQDNTPTPTATGSPGPGTPTATPTAETGLLVVNSGGDGDDGSCDLTNCTLREALRAANDRAGPDRITFAIPSSDPACADGKCRLQPGSMLPGLYDAGTTIDGYTQNGARRNAASVGEPFDGVIAITIDGSGIDAGTYPNGLVITGADCAVSGLAIGGFYGAIYVQNGDRAVIQGNFLGLAADGITQVPNACTGVSVSGGVNGPTGVEIGGATPGARNVIAAAQCVGIDMAGSNHRVMGNYIGTDASLAPAGNVNTGLRIYRPSTSLQVGGSGDGEANVVAFNGWHGVYLDADAGAVNAVTMSRNRIWGNSGSAIEFRGAANGGISTPVISSVSSASASGSGCPGCLVELFSDAADEAAIFEGQVRAGEDGRWTVANPPGLTGPNVTALQTDLLGNTSKLSGAMPINGPTFTPTSTRITPTRGTPTGTGTTTPPATPTATRTLLPGTPTPTATYEPGEPHVIWLPLVRHP